MPNSNFSGLVFAQRIRLHSVCNENVYMWSVHGIIIIVPYLPKAFSRPLDHILYRSFELKFQHVHHRSRNNNEMNVYEYTHRAARIYLVFFCSCCYFFIAYCFVAHTHLVRQFWRTVWIVPLRGYYILLWWLLSSNTESGIRKFYQESQTKDGSTRSRTRKKK